MMSSANIRLVARVAGLPAVVAIAILAFVGITYSPIPHWLMVFCLVVLACPIAAMTIRLWKGGGDGGTDLEIVQGQNRLVMANIPLSVSESLLSRAFGVFKPKPLPRPKGIVRGNPAQESNVELQQFTSLPEQIVVTEEPVEIPTDSASLSAIDVANINVRKIEREKD